MTARPRSWLLAAAVAVAIWGCGGARGAARGDVSGEPAGAGPPQRMQGAAQAERAVRAVLDDWHEAAAQGDLARYFGHLTDDAVFLGTDATERWTKPEFRRYAAPHFEDGEAWVFRAVRRAVQLGPHGDVAYFDEDLETEGLGPARGSGVLLRGADGTWRIAHYNLALTIPNALFPEVRTVLESAECDCAQMRVAICGHRGRGTTRPGNPLAENTLESMRAAIDEGAQMLELDVQLSSDGVPVVIHDATVDRTTDAEGCVGAMSAGELRALDAGGGARIPTLGEVVSELDVGLNVEIKTHPRSEGCGARDVEALVEAVTAALEADPHDRPVVVSSFDLEVLRAMRSRSPKLDLAYLTEEPEGLEIAIDEGFAGVNPHHRLVRPEVLDRLREAGLEVRPWTVNVPAEMRRLLELGVDAIITDEPAVLHHVRSRACARHCEQ